MITSDAGFILATPTKCATTSLEGVAKRHMKNAGVDGDNFRIMDWDHPRRQHRMCLPPAVRDATGGIDAGDGASEDKDHSEWERHDRWLLVRNPFDRYVSIYKYLSSHQNYSQWGAREVQGKEWGGPEDVFTAARERGEEWTRHPKMSFPQFIDWLCGHRERLRRPESVKARGPLDMGRAYRSPWVWTDSLTESAEILGSWPGNSGIEGFVTLEHLWGGEGDRGSLARMLRLYGVDTVDLSELHANRSTGWDGDVVFSPQFWGGFGFSREGVNSARLSPGRSANRDLVLRLGVIDEFGWWLDSVYY